MPEGWIGLLVLVGGNFVKRHLARLNLSMVNELDRKQ